MALILSFETSGNYCSAAVHNNGELVSAQQVREPQAHAAKLADLAQQVVKHAGIEFRSLNAIAITAGPGSYTGLRIGTSTAKGICYALHIPLIAVGTLELMVYQAAKIHKNSLLCAMIDARRMEVYSLLADQQGKIVKPVEAEVIEAGSYADFLSKEAITFFGSGAEKCKRIIVHPHAQFASDIEPDATALGEMATTKFLAGQVEDLVQFEPFYLKEFQIKKSSKPLF